MMGQIGAREPCEQNKVNQNMSKITFQNVLIVLGVLLLLSGMGSTANSGSDNSFAFVGGINLLLGALAIIARKRQSSTKSIKWLVVEVISILIILLTTVPSLRNGLLYLHPISLLFVPIIVAVGYLYTWHKFKKKSIGGK